VPVTGFALDRKNSRLYTSDADGFVSVWNTETGTAKWLTGKGHTKGVPTLALSADGSHLWTAGLDDKVRYNELKSGAYSADAVSLGGQPVAIATAHKDSALAVAVLSQEKLVVLRAGKIISTTELGFKPTSVAFSADDSEIAVGVSTGKIQLFSFGSDAAKATKTLSGHPNRIASLVYDGSFLVSTDTTKIYFWKGGETLNYTGWTFHSGVVTEVAFNPSSTVVASCSQDQDIILWSDLTKFEHYYMKFTGAHYLGVDHVGWLSDDSIISTGNDRCVKIWTLVKGGFTLEKKEEAIKQQEKEEKKQ